MYKLPVIPFVIKLYARNSVFKSTSNTLSQKMVNLFLFSKDLGTEMYGRTKGQLKHSTDKFNQIPLTCRFCIKLQGAPLTITKTTSNPFLV